jgi:hypothetical protein
MNKTLKSKILWKIYVVWFLKRILPLVVLEVLVIVGALYTLAQFVFVEQVVSNAFLNSASNPWRLAVFLFYAFLNTHWFTQLAILIFLGLGALLLRDFGRALASYRSTSRAAGFVTKQPKV